MTDYLLGQQFSNLSVRVAWEHLKFPIASHIPYLLNQNLWGWHLGIIVLEASQVIPMCSPV